MMGPPGSLARDGGTNSLKTSSVRGGRAAAAATPEAALRKKFLRVVGIGTSLFVCCALLIAEKGAGGQQNDSSGRGAVFRQPLRAQPVGATLARSLLAGVSKPKVFRGR